MSYLDLPGNPNPLWDVLLAEAGRTGGLTARGIQAFVERAADVADNLHRVASTGARTITDTVPHQAVPRISLAQLAALEPLVNTLIPHSPDALLHLRRRIRLPRRKAHPHRTDRALPTRG